MKNRQNIAQYAVCRGPLSGAHAEFAAEMSLAERAGHASWCNTLRDLHEGDLAYHAPLQMLREFAAAAPSAYLLGYVFGFIDVRESPDQYSHESAEAMIRDAGLYGHADQRGALLGCAFMAVIRPRGE